MMSFGFVEGVRNQRNSWSGGHGWVD